MQGRDIKNITERKQILRFRERKVKLIEEENIG